MSFKRALSRWEVLLVVALASLGAAVRINLALKSMEFLITELVPDDAFYYFTVSRNTALGRGISFDGINPTNGFHPLWMVLLIPVFAMLKEPASIRAALLIGAALNVTAGIVIYLFLRDSLRQARLIAVPMALLVLAGWMFSPYIVRQSVNGMETSLSILLLATAIFITMRLQIERATSLVAVSLVWGLVLLSRTDMFLFWIPAMTFIFLKKPNQNFKPIVISVAITFLVLTPWIIWNLLTFGSLVQSSAVAIPQVIRASWIAESANEVTPLRILSHVGNLVWNAFRQLLTFGNLTSRALLTVTGLSVIIVLTTKDVARRLVTLLAQNAYLLVGLAGWFIVHDAIRWISRDWYFIAPVFVIWIALSFFVSGAFTVFRNRRWLEAGVLYAGLLVWLISGPAAYTSRQLAPPSSRYPWQAKMLEGANWIRESLPEDALVGAWNAGILGFFSERVVINLDGVVNNEILPYVRNKEICEYLNDANVEYVADFDNTIYNYWVPFWAENGEPRLSLEPIWLASGAGVPFSVHGFNGEASFQILVFRMETSSPARRYTPSQFENVRRPIDAIRNTVCRNLACEVARLEIESTRGVE